MNRLLIASTGMTLLLAQVEDSTLTLIRNVGEFAGIVVTIMLFLKYLTARDEKIEKMFNDVVDRVEKIQANSEAHINRVSDNFIKVTENMQIQTQKLFDDHMQLTTKNIELVAELRRQIEIIQTPKQLP